MNNETALKEEVWHLYKNGTKHVNTCVRKVLLKALAEGKIERGRYVYLSGRLARFLKAKIKRNEGRKEIGEKSQRQKPKPVGSNKQILEDARDHELCHRAYQD